MNKNELPDYSAYIVMEYCKNNVKPYIDAFSEKCLWIGPAHGQIIHTKEALAAVLNSEEHHLTFAVQNLQVIPVSLSTTVLNVILTYTTLIGYPNGETIALQQRHELLWAEEKIKDKDGNVSKEYFIRVCHISTEMPYDKKDTVYPNHFAEMDITKVYTGRLSLSKMALKGLGGCSFYLSGNSILWMESKGKHTLIYTTDKTTHESIERFSAVIGRYENKLCRIHTGYAVNPMYVTEIGRFYVEMQDGKRLSIPAKKYTKTRDELQNRIMQLDH